MARRVPLPRLTQRQRTARWQRERRQQAVVVTAFTAVLLLVLGLAAWAATDRYHEANLTPAATIDGKVIPKREYLAQLQFELVPFYQAFGVPPGFENDPNLAVQKAPYQDVALERIIEQRILEQEARAVPYRPSPEDVERQYRVRYGEANARHILISVPADAEDTELAELTAAARARAIMNQLRGSPTDETWSKLAAAHSDDPGSRHSGGELGFASSGRYVAEFEEALRTLPVGAVSDLVKTQFGYHVIQVTERREPADTALVQRYLSSGYTVDDLREQARYDLLRAEFERRAKAAAVASPAEQVHLAKIVVNVPVPTAIQNFEQFTEALEKQTTVRTAVEEGGDFAELAREHSEDAASAEKGGDMGWVVRGMTVDPQTEEAFFGTEVGAVTQGITVGQVWTIYKVLEKDPAREVDDDQRKAISDNAYRYWLERQKQAHGVQKQLFGFTS